MPTPTILDRAVVEWRSRGVPLLPPASADEVGEVFEAIDYPLSADVRALYAATAGFADDGAAGLWSLWPLEEVRAFNSAYEIGSAGGPLIVFADYLLGFHLFGFRYESAAVSSVWAVRADGSDEPVAGSVAEFLGTLIDEPERVHAFLAF